MRLKDKTALITGGGRGIGAATALMMLAEGARVGVVDINEDTMRKTGETARARGYDLKTFAGDITEKEQVEHLVGDFVKEVGRIDILVNNAGIVISRPFFEKTADDWIRTLKVNVIGLFLCSQAAARYMVAQKSGKIINISPSGASIIAAGRESWITALRRQRSST